MSAALSTRMQTLGRQRAGRPVRGLYVKFLTLAEVRECINIVAFCIKFTARVVCHLHIVKVQDQDQRRCWVMLGSGGDPADQVQVVSSSASVRIAVMCVEMSSCCVSLCVWFCCPNFETRDNYWVWLPVLITMRIGYFMEKINFNPSSKIRAKWELGIYFSCQLLFFFISKDLE